MRREKVTVFWFRRDLRLEDNPGLREALRGPHPVLPFFLFDKDILKGLPKRDARVEFIHRAVSDLSAALAVRRGTFLVMHGRPRETFTRLLGEFDIARVHANRDWEPRAMVRDGEVDALLKAKGAALRFSDDHALMPPGAVVKDDGKPYTVFTPYYRKWRSMLSAAPPRPVPVKFRSGTLWKGRVRAVPSLASLGFAPAGIPFPPSRVPLDIVKGYARTHDIPSIRGTTRLGLHLRFGTLGIRTLAAKVWSLDETFLRELAWRDFFLQVMASFPRVVEGPFRREFANVAWRDDEASFRRWREGETGYPWVDAGMRELNATGFMHNRVRMAVASFLAKHLLIDWRRGEAYFAEKLLDFELSSNNGNWQWAAGCGCDAAPYFRVFNPALQAKRFDPGSRYVQKWVPEAGSSRYPAPVVDHGLARVRVLSAFRYAIRSGRKALE